MSNYNIDPYFDDFDKTKNYVRVLFKPGVPVQARELTQMQTAIQEQIKSLGSFMFKNESLVLGGESRSFDVIFVDVLSGDLSSYEGKTFISQTNKSKIKVISYKNNVSSGVSRLYFSYLNGKRITAGEVLVENVTAPTVPSLTVTNSANNVGVAKAFKLLESVFYVKEFFVVAPEQTVILGDSVFPTVKVGLKVTEQVVTYQDDETLLDPSSGTLNYAAPGADRLQISLDLVISSYDPVADSDADVMIENTEDNFIELARYKYGVLVKSLKNPSLGAIEDVMARRTFDESGNYTVKSFKAKVVNNVKKNPDLLSIAVEPGKAYVKGYEFETSSTITVDLDKAREYDSEQNTFNEAGYGDYFIVTNPTGGNLNYDSNVQISLRNVSNTVIGSAYISYVKAHSSTQLKVYVTNVVVNSGYAISQVTNLYSSPWTAAVDSTNTEKLYRGKSSALIIPLKDTPTRSVYDTSFVSQIKTSGTASATTLSPTTALSVTGKSYISSDPLDYIAVNQSNGTRATITSVTGLTSSTFVLNGTFTNGALYDIYAKISVSTQAKTKTRTSATVYLTNNYSTITSLGISDVYRIVNITASNTTGTQNLNVTTYFDLDNGQRDYLYDNASIVLKPGKTFISATTYPRLIVQLEYFAHSSSTGFFTVDSYDTTNTNDSLVVPYENIPSYKMNNGKIVSLRDVIDYRPRRANIASWPGTLVSPIGSTLSSVISGSEICEPGNYVTTDYEFYLPRIDKLIITKEKRFDIIRGVASKNPGIPTDLPDAMTIYNVIAPAYTFSAKEVKLEYVENKRYTMKDIGKIDSRVSRMEYYTAMSLLEKQASDETIVNASGMDKFKNGILVDSFAGFGVSDVGSADFSASIDSVTRTLRPRFAKQTVGFDLNRNETSSTAYSLREQIVTLPYSTEVSVNNSQATNWTDIQRYSTFFWEGEVKLFPSSDTWSDQTQRPDVIVNVNGDNDAFTVLADNVANPASTGVKWSDWQFVDRGVDISSVSSSRDNVTYALTNGTTGRAIENTETTTTTTTTTVVNDLYYASGIQIDSSSVSTITRDLGTKVVDASLVPFIRSRVVDFAAGKLQPNTIVYASFDNVNVSSFCVQAPSIYVTTIPNATRVRKAGTSKAADVVLLRSHKAFVKMDSGEYLFSAGDNIEWFVEGAWITGSAISEVVAPSNDSLVTDEAGDIAGFFTIPAGTFRTGERAFRIADDLGNRPNTAAESKYVAMGLAMSLQKDVISTRVQTVSINPVSKSTTNTTVNVDVGVEVANVQRDVTVSCGDTANASGRQGRFTYEIDFGTDIGQCGVNYDASGIPDRYTIIWNGREYTSGFRGDSNYNTQLNALGYPSVTSTIDSNNPSSGRLRFEKTSIFPNKAQLIVDAPLSGTAWAWKIICPGKTDNLLPETSPLLNVGVDTPSVVSLQYTARSNAGVSLSVLTAPTSASFNFTIRINGNQSVPAGTPVILNSLTTTEYTNGLWPSFGSGTTFRRNGQVVSLPLTLVTGETYTFNASFDLTSSARILTTTLFGAYRAPIVGISASAQLVTNIDGYSAYASGYDETNISSSWEITEFWDTATCRHDPLAQTFYVSSRENPDGIFVDSIDMFFKEKNEDDDASVTVQIRPTVNGYPSSSEVLPLATSTLLSRDITTSLPEETSKAATKFRFEAPVYLTPDTEYAVVIGSSYTGFQMYISRIGEFLLTNSNVRATKQPLSGTMFYSSTGSTWTAEQTDDLCMRLNKCVFPVNVNRSVVLGNVTDNAQKQSTSIDYDMIFIDGEILDFSSTNVDYFIKTAQTSGSTFAKDSSWTPYQWGSNTTMKNRRSLNPNDPDTLRIQCVLSTTNRDVSPVVDLSRISGTLVQNIINNTTNSETETSTASISNVSATTSVITVTTSPAHGFSAGDYVLISANEQNSINGLRKIESVPSSTTFTVNWTGTAITSAAATGTITRKNQALSRYITRKVTLNSEFFSDDMRLYYYANIPSGCQVIPYYRVTSLTDPILEDNAWVPMTLESSGTPTSTGYVEYKFKTPYVDGNGDTVALSTGERYGTFAVKLVMLSSDTTKVPLVKDLRVLALTN